MFRLIWKLMVRCIWHFHLRICLVPGVKAVIGCQMGSIGLGLMIGITTVYIEQKKNGKEIKRIKEESNSVIKIPQMGDF